MKEPTDGGAATATPEQFVVALYPRAALAVAHYARTKIHFPGVTRVQYSKKCSETTTTLNALPC